MARWTTSDYEALADLVASQISLVMEAPLAQAKSVLAEEIVRTAIRHCYANATRTINGNANFPRGRFIRACYERAYLPVPSTLAGED